MVNAFEIYVDNLPKIKFETQKKKFILNDFQPIYRDFAFIIDDTIRANEIVNTVKKINKELIKEVHIFDIYKNVIIGENKKSIAFSIKIQPLNKVLTTEDINVIGNKIINEIQI